MSEPQLENGYTAVANEIIEQLCKINLGGHESRVLWAIIRQSYGYHKTVVPISHEKFYELVHLERRHVHRALRNLKYRDLIVIRTDDTGNITYQFQKNNERWKTSSLRMTVDKDRRKKSPSSVRTTLVIHPDDAVSSVRTTPVIHPDDKVAHNTPNSLPNFDPKDNLKKERKERKKLNPAFKSEGPNPPALGSMVNNIVEKQDSEAHIQNEETRRKFLLNQAVELGVGKW